MFKKILGLGILLSLVSLAFAQDVDLIVQGNVGIGTTSPGALLELAKTDTASTTTSYVQKIGGTVNSGVALTNWYGSYITAPTVSGTLTNKYALVTEASAGNVGIGTTNPQAKLDVAGRGIFLNGVYGANGAKPAFFVNVNGDDCGWAHPYLGCPAGYVVAGFWHVGETGFPGCDTHSRGSGYENGSISQGWMVLCVAQ